MWWERYDLNVGARGFNPLLYQTELRSHGGFGEVWTRSLRLKRTLLCHLSYEPMKDIYSNIFRSQLRFRPWNFWLTVKRDTISPAGSEKYSNGRVALVPPQLSQAYETRWDTYLPPAMVGLSGYAPDSNDYKSFALLLCYRPMASPSRLEREIKEPESFVLPITPRRKKKHSILVSKIECPRKLGSFHIFDKV